MKHNITEQRLRNKVRLLGQTAGRLWRDKWEQTLTLLGYLATMATGVSVPQRLILSSGAILLGIDLRQGWCHHYHLAREKHIPLAMIVGKGDDQYRAMLDAVLQVMRTRDFDEDEFASKFRVERQDWVVQSRHWLPPEPKAWEDLVARFHARLHLLSRFLSGKLVHHVFLNCPVALSVGLGAVMRRSPNATVYHWLGRGTHDQPYAPVLDLTGTGGDAAEGRQTESGAGLLRGRLEPPYRYIKVEQPEALTQETYVSFHLADHDPKGSVQALADQKGRAAVHIRNKCDDTLSVDEDWITPAREVAGVLRQLAARPEVKRLHLSFSCPGALAFAIGMGVGTVAAVTMHNWFADEQAYHPVLELDQLSQVVSGGRWSPPA